MGELLGFRSINCKVTDNALPGGAGYWSRRTPLGPAPEPAKLTLAIYNTLKIKEISMLITPFNGMFRPNYE
jgi:hypothetical protein